MAKQLISVLAFLKFVELGCFAMEGPKGLDQFIDRIRGNISINLVQKIALLGTAQILRKITVH